MSRTRVSQYGWLWIVLIATAGCSGVGLIPVRGTVKLDGQALAGASILFIAQDASGRNATGFTDANGLFRLSTFEREDGALPGQYKVVVQPPAAAAPDAPPAATPEEAQRAATPGESRPAVTIPARYSRPDQTILVQEVPASGDILYELKSK